MTSDAEQRRHQDQQRLAAFVVRARRVEQHSLAQDKEQLLRLACGQIHLHVEQSSGRTWWTQNLPPEEQVESAAARVRPFILEREEIHHGKVMNSLGRLLHDSADSDTRTAARDMRSRWAQFKPGSEDVRGWGAQIANTATGDVHEPVADNTLAFAWIYGDTVHADAERLAKARDFGVLERYRAAVPLVCQLMVTTIATLNLVRNAHEKKWLNLHEGTLTQPVVVTEAETQTQNEVQAFYAPANGTTPRLGEPLGPEWRRLGGPGTFNLGGRAWE